MQVYTSYGDHTHRSYDINTKPAVVRSRQSHEAYCAIIGEAYVLCKLLKASHTLPKRCKTMNTKLAVVSAIPSKLRKPIMFCETPSHDLYEAHALVQIPPGELRQSYEAKYASLISSKLRPTIQSWYVYECVLCNPVKAIRSLVCSALSRQKSDFFVRNRHFFPHLVAPFRRPKNVCIYCRTQTRKGTLVHT